jgi:hypothetical protein
MSQYKSECCNADTRVGGRDIREISTHWYICCACGKPCDIKEFNCFDCIHYDSYEHEFRFMDKCKIRAYEIVECCPVKINCKGHLVPVRCEKKTGEVKNAK